MPGQEIASCILALLDARAATAVDLPLEVARALAPDAWRPVMPRALNTAREMARRGLVDISARGEVLDPSQKWTGPVRIRRVARD